MNYICGIRKNGGRECNRAFLSPSDLITHLIEKHRHSRRGNELLNSYQSQQNRTSRRHSKQKEKGMADDREGLLLVRGG